MCTHQQREENEVAFIYWRSPAAIAEAGGPRERLTPCHALGLFRKPQQNIRAALERIIEKAGKLT